MLSTDRPAPRGAVPPGPETLWVLPSAGAPLSYVIEEYRRAHGPAEMWCWTGGGADGRSYGRQVTLRTSRAGYDLTVKAVSPRLAADIHAHPAAVVLLAEIDLAALFALAGKALRRLPLPRSAARRRRRVVVLVEGDVTAMGLTGSARWKVAFRRLVARGVDAFVANNAAATTYLTETLGVPAPRIVQGWWLAGLPEDLPAEPPDAEVLARGEGPVLVGIGQLIERKGHDLLLRAAAAYTREVGPCRVWILGTGPQRAALEALAASLGIGPSVSFLGHTTHAQLKGALQHADAFVFPTLGDLIGRVVAEVLSVGVPVVVSQHSGAIGTLLHDGVNAVVVDPRDTADLLRGLRAVTDPVEGQRLREGAEAASATVSVAAAASVIHRGVQRAQ